MAELADALDLGSSGNPRAGSSPVTRTKLKGSKFGLYCWIYEPFSFALF